MGQCLYHFRGFFLFNGNNRWKFTYRLNSLVPTYLICEEIVLVSSPCPGITKDYDKISIIYKKRYYLNNSIIAGIIWTFQIHGYPRILGGHFYHKLYANFSVPRVI